MCLKKSYCAREVDPCLQVLVKAINQIYGFKTLSSCCGHDVYPMTIITKDTTGKVFEFFSGILLELPKRNRFYKRDKKGLYFIPKIESLMMQRVDKKKIHKSKEGKIFVDPVDGTKFRVFEWVEHSEGIIRAIRKEKME